MERKKITVKELAQKLGVSISTVSKALNDSYEISDKTKKKVRRLAEKYNYKPNRLAVNLKAGSTRTIGVILPSILSNFFTAVLYGIEQVTNEADYSIITCFSNESFDREVTYVDILSNGAIDGLIVAIAEETQIKKDFSHFESCIEEGNPVVMFDRVTKSIECDKVVVDDFNDARMATQHLLDCGCRNLALVSAIDFLSVGKDRVKGFVSRLEEVQGSVDQGRIVRCGVSELEDHVDRILDDLPVDGFFAVDEDASLAIRVATAGASVLVMGGAARDTEARLLVQPLDLASEVVIAVDQVGPGTCGVEWLEAVRPRTVVVSTSGTWGYFSNTLQELATITTGFWEDLPGQAGTSISAAKSAHGRWELVDGTAFFVVYGEICITNSGEQPTENLAIRDVIQ